MSEDFPEIEYDWDEEPPEIEFECTSCGRCCVSPGGMRTVVHLSQEDVDQMPLHVLQMTTEKYMPKYEDFRIMKNVEKPDGLGCIAFRGRVGKKCGCAIYEWRPWHCRHFHPGTHCLPYLETRAKREEELRSYYEGMG
jgi:Fe-S-cluster containining protein